MQNKDNDKHGKDSLNKNDKISSSETSRRPEESYQGSTGSKSSSSGMNKPSQSGSENSRHQGDKFQASSGSSSGSQIQTNDKKSGNTDRERLDNDVERER